MKKFLIFITLSLSLVACSNNVSETPAKGALNNVRYALNTTNREQIDGTYINKLSDFAGSIYDISKEDDNFVISPISIYMALAMMHQVGDATSKAEIETLLGMDNTYIDQTGDLFSKLVYEFKEEDTLVSRCDLSNSVWVNQGTKTHQEALDELADKLYCYAFEAPFKKNNKQANKAIKEFIKERTNGLIDQDFNLDVQTLFALINTLYLKDVWREYGELQTSQRIFHNATADKTVEFLDSGYAGKEVLENEISSYCYASTIKGYKLKFIVPKEGHTLEEAMSPENIAFVNNTKSYFVSDDGGRHMTRCIFPSFKVDSDVNLLEDLTGRGYLTYTASGCKSNLIDEDLFLSEIKHVAKLKVDKKGIEGAAVTMAVYASSAYDPRPIYYHDFIVDKNFGFLVTSPQDVVLFAGQIKNM